MHEILFLKKKKKKKKKNNGGNSVKNISTLVIGKKKKKNSHGRKFFNVVPETFFHSFLYRQVNNRSQLFIYFFFFWPSIKYRSLRVSSPPILKVNWSLLTSGTTDDPKATTNEEAVRSLLVITGSPPSNPDYEDFKRKVNEYDDRAPFSFPNPFKTQRKVSDSRLSWSKILC